MISKQYFEADFSIDTARALQAWANNNLIEESFGDYALEVNWASNGGDSTMFAETSLVGLPVGESITVRLYVEDIASNSFKIRVNELPNDNTSMVAEIGFGKGWREFSFVSTASTMYLAIGDDGGSVSTFSISDNITVKDSTGTNYVTNSYFETDTTGWYGQSANTVLTRYQYVVTPPIGGDSPYLEQFSIPLYDAGNPKHFVITSNADWSHINDADKTNFYVTEGNYLSLGRITINASGSSITPRTISPLDNIDVHPAKLPDNELCQYALYLNAANYWIVDKAASVNSNLHPEIDMRNGADHNIISEHYNRACKKSVQIGHQCHNNTIQRCRYEDMTLAVLSNDTVPINLFYYSDSPLQIHNTKILDCETRNCCDGMQIIRTNPSGGDYQEGNCEGTIIDGNHFYITDEIYTDGAGNLDPNGDRAMAENGIDLKIGSTNPSNRMTISNNHLWGMRESDTSGSLSSRGTALSGHYEVLYTDIVNNVIFDSAAGIGMGAKYNFPYAQGYLNITGNLIVDCGGQINDGGRPISMSQGIDMTITNNTILNSRQAYYRSANNNGFDFHDNAVINYALEPIVETDTNGTYAPNDVQDVDPVTVGYTEDYVFTTDRYGNSPRQITIPNCVKPV